MMTCGMHDDLGLFQHSSDFNLPYLNLIAVGIFCPSDYFLHLLLFCLRPAAWNDLPLPLRQKPSLDS